jgi:pyrroloquinoline quinone (PQQ) biosynthesis protein C
MVEGVHEHWLAAMKDLQETPFFRRLRDGTLDARHYRVLLREIYYNTRENPPSFALMAWHLKGRRRDIAKRVYRHCAAEHGHHELALADLRALGADVAGIPEGRPLPTTEAFLAFALYHAQHRNPLAYLGYVYHLEMLPAMMGGEIISRLRAAGIPDEAMSFLTEHAHADEVHSRWTSDYIREAVADEEDLAAVRHGAVGSCRLHGIMLAAVVDAAEDGSGWNAVPAVPGTSAPSRLAASPAARPVGG